MAQPVQADAREPEPFDVMHEGVGDVAGAHRAAVGHTDDQSLVLVAPRPQPVRGLGRLVLDERLHRKGGEGHLPVAGPRLDFLEPQPGLRLL